MLLFWILVVAGIVALVRALSSRSGGGSPAAPESPIDILKRRYASGEIGKPEFEEKMKDLGERHP
jgi:putative membrane protein